MWSADVDDRQRDNLEAFWRRMQADYLSTVSSRPEWNVIGIPPPTNVQQFAALLVDHEVVSADPEEFGKVFSRVDIARSYTGTEPRYQVTLVDLFCDLVGHVGADNSADSPQKSKKKLPDNPDVMKLAKHLSKRDADKSQKASATEFCKGDAKRADNLLRQLRRYPDLKAIADNHCPRGQSD